MKILCPKAEFYQIYSDEQIKDIIKSLLVYKEIPLKYSYFNTGACSWDEQVTQMLDKNIETITPNTYELLYLDTEYILKLVHSYEVVNIIDIGPGNGLPLKNLIEFLYKKGRLGGYIAVDFSSHMLELVEKNMKKWFGGGFPFYSRIGDVTSNEFCSIFTEELTPLYDKKATINVFFFLGGTIENNRSYNGQLRAISTAMKPNDILILEHGFDLESVDRPLIFGVGDSKDGEDLQHRRMVLDLLNIDKKCYRIERFFSKGDKANIIRIVFNLNLTLEILVGRLKKRINFLNNDAIVVWRYNSHTMLDVFKEMHTADYKVLQMMTSVDGESLLIIAKKKSEVLELIPKPPFVAKA